MNLQFPKMPTLLGDHYVHRTPKWLVILFRLSFGIGGAGLAILSFRDWGGMPPGFRALALILIPVFVFFAIQGRTWRNTVKFLTDDRGLFFPCNELIAATVGQESSNNWLLVPWNHISNIRVAKEIDHEGGLCICVAFEVKVSSEEQAKFFLHVGYPTDRAQHTDSQLSVAYSDSPPFPKNTVALLQEMKRRHTPGTLHDKAAQHR